MQNRYATADEILEASRAYCARTGTPTMNDVIEGRVRDPDPAWTRKVLRGFEAVYRIIDRENETLERDQGPPDLGLAVQALIDSGTVYTPKARDTAARWIAEALGGLPGDPRAQAEVKGNLRILARLEGRPRLELRRELVLAAAPEGARSIGHWPAREDTPGKRVALADALLVVVRRELRRVCASAARYKAARDALRAEPELLNALPAERDFDLAASLEAARLTPRQRDVLEALAQTGCDSAAVAAHLGLSPSRVRAYLAEIRALATAQIP